MSRAQGKAQAQQASEDKLLLYLIKQVQQKSSMRLGATLQPYGVTAVQFRVLAEVRRYNRLSSAELSRLFNVRPQTMNKQIAQLEELGLIERSCAPDNRRVLEVSLSETGLNTLRQCLDAAQALELEIFRTFSAQQQDAFRTHLLELLRSMD